ncbi:uncharacterized protein LOC116303333 [Actinia tenebrosa]|uniref:Uncharacterized protein LOC116303333 n=1 Tax=Actinia tenebrosa TaxID=6105 RepID=A0A6P8IPA4_ACTTE|nr:uncharacterized protein LOC116303333 [Actinia tenebrosa]
MNKRSVNMLFIIFVLVLVATVHSSSSACAMTENGCCDILSEESCNLFREDNKCSAPSFSHYCQYTCGRCHAEWRRVTKEMVQSTYSVGVELKYSDIGGGLQIKGDVTKNGCGKTTGSGAITFIKGNWIKIKYTQEFIGRVSCWKIFGGTAYPKYRKQFAFSIDDECYYPRINNLMDLSAAEGDKIYGEHLMNSDNNSKFDGRVYRCDNKTQNFWESNNDKGMRGATVELRRSPAGGEAGISTETSCGTPRYIIKDIYVK